MIRARVLILAVLASVSLAETASAQSPPPAKPLAESLTGMAKADYAAGRVLFGDGDAAGALVKFRAAHEASKEPRLLWNIAACEKALHHYARALTLVESYRAEAGPALDEGEREEADRIILALSPLVAKMSVNVEEPAASVTVDDEAVGTTPLAPLRVDLGRRHLVVKKRGFRDHDALVLVTGAADVVVDVKLAREIHEGRLFVRAPSTATVAVDNRVVGTGSWEGKLPSGGHSLRVTSQGMRTYQTDVYVQDDQTRTLDVVLEPEPKSGIPTWLWIAGGAVVAGGLAAGGYFLVKPGDPVSPEPTSGSLAPGFVVVR